LPNIVKDNAICIRRSDYSETSQVVTLFARDSGKVGGLAKGSKRPKNRSFAGGFELLTAGSVVFRTPRSTGLALLTEWAPTETFGHLRSDLAALHHAYYLAELLDRMTEQLDPHPALYEPLLRSLRALANPDGRAAVLLAFEYYLLRVLGMLPNLRQCACGRVPPQRGSVPFNPEAGTLVCGRCDLPVGADLQATAAVRAGFEALRRGPVLGEAAALPARRAVAMSHLLRRYVTHQLGRPLRTLRYLPVAGD
jgi:DNA repair protein RecO (recombination protein O)